MSGSGSAAGSNGMQVFFWAQESVSRKAPDRIFYDGFSLNGVDYAVGDCVLLFPENDGEHYIGRINAAFCLTDPASTGASDAHCIEVTWFERRTNLEPDFKGCQDKEREVVELEETDINPIGCISGKCALLRALKFEDAAKQSKGLKSAWFFCRGVFKQNINSFVLYTELAALEEQADAKRAGKRTQPLAPEHVADSEEVLAATSKRPRPSDPQPPASAEGPWGRADAQHGDQESTEEVTTAQRSRPLKVVATGRVCVECGATQTPQWREGPQGPKTLCNACGVRYVRAQQRANKRAVGTVASSRPSPVQASRKMSVQANPAAAVGSKGKAKGDTPCPPASAAAPSVSAAVGAPPQPSSRSRAVPQQQHAEEPVARPMRQAALLAANRTAQFARTGVFPVDNGDVKQQAAAQAPQAQQLQLPAAPSSGHASPIAEPQDQQQPTPPQPESHDDSNNSDDFVFDAADHQQQHHHGALTLAPGSCDAPAMAATVATGSVGGGLSCHLNPLASASADDLLGLNGADSAVVPLTFVAADDDDDATLRSIASMEDDACIAGVHRALDDHIPPPPAGSRGLHHSSDNFFDSFDSALPCCDMIPLQHMGGLDHHHHHDAAAHKGSASGSARSVSANKAFGGAADFGPSSSSMVLMDCADTASLIHNLHGLNPLLDVSNAGGLLAVDGGELVSVHT